MRREPHPMSGVIYEELGDGKVRVEDREHGKYGVFRWNGVWLEGDLAHADPHMLYIIGGPDLPPGKDIFWSVMPPVEGTSMAKTTSNPSRSAGRGAAQRPRIIAPSWAIPANRPIRGCDPHLTSRSNTFSRMIGAPRL